VKFIEKGVEPPALTEWINSETKRRSEEGYPNPVPAFNDIQNPLKSQITESLFRDQGNICCYCQRRLDSHPPISVPQAVLEKMQEFNRRELVTYNRKSCTIEHIKPQAICKPGEDINYSNMLASCSGREENPCNSHCNLKRGQKPLHISPLDTNCEDHFIYNAVGEIIVRTDSDSVANSAISNLGLNVPPLRDDRQHAWDTIADDLNETDRKEFIEFYSSRDENGFFHPFSAVLIYRLKNL